ncbi:A33 protein, partial [Thinocorus orbignyianus]|nr:A33 protein [Thinocorus orbignyianus]
DSWALGVAKESVRRKGRLKVNPEGGVWAVGRCGGQCQALTCPPRPISFPGVTPPEIWGVFLDYEAGRVAFLDARDQSPLF